MVSFINFKMPIGFEREQCVHEQGINLDDKIINYDAIINRKIQLCGSDLKNYFILRSIYYPKSFNSTNRAVGAFILKIINEKIHIIHEKSLNI